MFGRRKLKHQKKIKICGIKFVIQKINPIDLLDKDQNLKIPDIFKYSDRVSLAEHMQKFGSPEFKRATQEMKPIIQAGLYSPKLDGQPYEYDDLFRDIEIGVKLYEKIIIHSLAKFKKKTLFPKPLVNT